jgi:X-X-X-Leu-X-X-Gly heptad repeat protein
MGDGVTSGGNAITSMGKVGSFAVPVTATSYTIPTSGCYGSTLFYGAAGSATLPSGEVGMNLLIYNTAANVITVKPAGAEVIVVDGTAKAASGSFTLASGAGNFVTLIHDGLKWITLGAKGTLT